MKPKHEKPIHIPAAIAALECQAQQCVIDMANAMKTTNPTEPEDMRALVGVLFIVHQFAASLDPARFEVFRSEIFADMSRQCFLER